MGKVSAITIGIQFVKAFRVLDSWGTIVDTLLSKSCEYFDTKYFPRTQAHSYEKSLVNDETEDYLRLSSDTLLYCHHLLHDEISLEVERQRFQQRVNLCLAKHILDKYELIISRSGIVYETIIDDMQHRKFVSKYFKDGLAGITAFRFSKREVTPEAIRSKGIDNYINKIFTVSNTGESKVLTFDYQEYFIPAVPCWYDSKPNDFFSKSWTDYSKEVLSLTESNK